LTAYVKRISYSGLLQIRFSEDLEYLKDRISFFDYSTLNVYILPSLY